MKAGELQACQMSLFTAMAEVVSGVFGGGKTTSPATGPITEDLTQLEPQQYVSRVNQLFNGMA